MLSVVHAGCLVGIEAQPVQVEVQLGRGLPGFDIVGLPERGVRESRVRVKAALESSGFTLPPRRLVVNLAPGDVRKTGASFDLAIAIAMLAASNLVGTSRLASTLLLGELSLTGSLRPVKGVLAQLRSARRRGLRNSIVPRDNASEAALCTDIDVRSASNVLEVVDWLDGRADLPPVDRTLRRSVGEESGPDLKDVRGQASAKRALEIAAAGGHHALLFGPPGGGKTMLARRLPSLLPPPTNEEAMEIATIAGAAGAHVASAFASIARPFRAPHHTASPAALIGGGDPVQPGEVTLAHGGVLFLDELPEFRRDAIESLRTTIESGWAMVTRARCRVCMPAQSLLVGAMNPCPCGHAGDPRHVCICAPDRIEKYRARVSGPLLDRFDMHIAVPRLSARALRKGPDEESSACVRERVIVARERAMRRVVRSATLEASIGTVATDALGLLEEAMDRMGLSARGYTKTLRVARTIADLEGSDLVSAHHVAEAIQYRALDRSRVEAPSVVTDFQQAANGGTG